MFTAPWALLGLLAVPLVFGIYFFRTRSRRREVSALFLWAEHSHATQGGRKIQRLQLPLLILLEIFALVLLAAAAAKPMLKRNTASRPATFLLDASYSMQASDGKDTAQQRAAADLIAMLRGAVGYPVQFIAVGTKPQLLLYRAKNASEANEALKKWSCTEPAADWDAALAFAKNNSLPNTKFIVVTDQLRKNGSAVTDALLQKSYGKKLGNIALLNARRKIVNRKDRVLLEIANFSEAEQTLEFTIIETATKRILLHEKEKKIKTGESFLFQTAIPDGVETLQIRLEEDTLNFDNQYTLAAPPKPLRVQLGALPDGLSEKIKKAVEASELGILVSERPEIVFGQIAGETPPLLSVQFLSGTGEPQSYIAPFIFDHSNPLVMGLSLDGVIWTTPASAAANATTSTAIIAAGNVPLLTESRRVLTFNVNDKLSTLTTHPAFPVLIWNILKRSQEQRENTPSLAVSTLFPFNADESNLLAAATESTGSLLDGETVRSDFQSIVWLLLLITLGVLTAHLRFTTA